MTSRKVGEGNGAKPLHVVARDARGQTTGHQAVWDEIRKQREFTVRSLWLAIEKRRGGNMRTIKGYVFRLQLAGYVAVRRTEKIENANRVHTYGLERDNGIEAPRLTKTGAESRPMQIEHIWRSIRILGEFSHRDIAVSASTEELIVSERQARRYLRSLAEAGYIVETNPGRRHVSVARYRFLPAKYTGPKPPLLSRDRDAVFDQNLNKIVWQREEAE